MKILATFLAVLLFAWAITAQRPTPIPTPQPAASPSPAPKPFLMPVEDSFYISGRGVVATGRVERGSIKVGDTVEIVGFGGVKTTTVTAIEMFRKTLDEANEGANVGLLLRGVEKADIKRGQVIAKPGSINAYTKCKTKIDMQPSSEGGRRTPFASGYRPLIYIRTGSFSGVVTLPEGIESVAPGDRDIGVEIELTESAPLETGQILYISESGKTVGTVVITKCIQ